MRGRQYPWGVVEVENPSHCDFVYLRTMLITHMQDLQEVTHDVHYENYRSQRLAKVSSGNSSGGEPRENLKIQSTTRITETSITNPTRITNEMATSSDYLMKYFNGILAVLLE